MRRTSPATPARALAAGLALVSLFGLVACSDDETTQDDAGASSSETFSPPEGGYSVVFPGGDPQRQEQAVPAPDGTSVSAVFHIAEDGDRAYAIGVATMPDAAVEDPQGFLEASQSGALQGTGATLNDSTGIDVQGRPGVEFTAAVTSNGVDGSVVNRVLLDGNQQYQIVVTGAGQFDTSDEHVQAFFESFQFDD